MTNGIRTTNNGSKGAGALISLLGLTTASLLLVSVPEDEGTELRAYKDIVGVWTICNGDTYDVVPGQVATPAECQERLARQLYKHAEPVILSSPNLINPGMDYPRAAMVSFAYNSGVAAYKTSTVRKRVDAGNIVGACDALLSWNRGTFRKPYNGGKCIPKKSGGWSCVVRGLDLRRHREREVCITNVVPGATPQNLKKRVDLWR